MPIGLEGTHTATQQDALELLNMTGRGGYDLQDSPSPGRLLPVCDGQAMGKAEDTGQCQQDA